MHSSIPHSLRALLGIAAWLLLAGVANAQSLTCGADSAQFQRALAKENGWLKPQLSATDKALWPAFGTNLPLPLASAQNNKTAGSSPDCATASPICASVFASISSFNGRGTVQELPRRTTCLRDGELHSNWFIFTIEQSGALVFTANPGPEVDFDFALYRITQSGCQAIPSLMPLRCNYSADGGPTGLILPASADLALSVDAFGDATMPALNVLAGETYALLLNNYDEVDDATYSLVFDTGPGLATVVDNTPPRLADTNPLQLDCERPFSRLTLTFNEPIDCATLSTTAFTMTGPVGAVVQAVYSPNCGTLTGSVTIDFQLTSNTNGTYTLRHIGGLRDLCGNPLDSTLSIDFVIDEEPFVPIFDTLMGCPNTQQLYPLPVRQDITYQWLTDTLPNTQPFSTDNPGPLTFGNNASTLFAKAFRLGCFWGYHQIRLLPYPTPVSGFVMNPTNPARDSLVTLTANPDTDTALTYLWRVNGDTLGGGASRQTAFTDGGPVIVELIVSNRFGCQTISNQRFIVKPPTYLPFAPNAFSPNGDGINELFIIPGDYAPQQFTLRIFDRWGRVVAEITNPKGGWDGFDTDGKPAPEGTYTYSLQVILSDDVPLERAGSLVLIR